MDVSARCLITITTPLLFYIARGNYRSLLSVIVLVNPFTIALLILGLNCLTKCKESNEDQVYIYFKCWLYSTHVTFLLAFQYYVIPSLQITNNEVVILYSSYILLLVSILNLKLKELNTKSLPDNEKLQILGVDQPCLQNGYLRLLAYPIVKRDKNMDWINGNGARLLPFSTSFLNSPTTHNNYLLFCNFLHLAILAQMLYLNITFTCACNTSKLFGRYLLIPMECSNIYESTDARVSMFMSIYSGQLLFCQLVFLLKTSLLR